MESHANSIAEIPHNDTLLLPSRNTIELKDLSGLKLHCEHFTEKHYINTVACLLDRLTAEMTLERCPMPVKCMSRIGSKNVG